MAQFNLLASGIDYLRFTIEDKNEAVPGLIDYFDEKQSEEEEKHGEIEYFDFFGFYGPMSRYHFYGKFGDKFMFQVSSAPAHELALWLKAFQYEVQVSRIDFHATAQGDSKLGEFAMDIRNKIRAVERKKGKKRRVRIDIVDDPGKGQSVSMGSRKSGTRDRSYDKGLESKGEVGQFVKRDECEIGKKRARKMWAEVLSCDSLEQLALDVVVARYKSRGVKLPYSDKAREYNLPPVYEPSNEERIAEWLIRCAASAFRKVKNEALRKAVAEAFGLGYKRLPDTSKPRLSKDARHAAATFHEMREMRANRGADLLEVED
jgi:hypothetical protein